LLKVITIVEGIIRQSEEATLRAAIKVEMMTAHIDTSAMTIRTKELVGVTLIGIKMDRATRMIIGIREDSTTTLVVKKLTIIRMILTNERIITHMIISVQRVTTMILIDIRGLKRMSIEKAVGFLIRLAERTLEIILDRKRSKIRLRKYC
jgi:hypothetical protein